MSTYFKHYLLGKRANTIFSACKSLRGTLALKSYVALIDQGLASGANFLITVLLARQMIPAEFGVFVLTYSILLFIKSLQMALITQPMSVLGVPLEGREVQKYFSSLTIGQLILGVCFVMILLVGACLLDFIPMQTKVAPTFFAMALASFPYQGQEYFRRALFARFKTAFALLNDFLCYSLQTIGIILLYLYNLLSGPNVFYVIGISSAIAMLYGYIQCHEFIGSDFSKFKKIIKKNWDHGKWLLSSTLLMWTSGQAYFFIAAFFLGPVAPAVLRAAQNVYGPTHVLLNGLEGFAPQIASKKYSSGGIEKLNNFLKFLLIILLVIMGLYCLFASLGSEFLLNILYKKQYSGYGKIVMLLGITYILNSLMRVPSIGLRAINKPKGIFYAHAASSCVTIGFGILLVKFLGITGAVLGTVISALTVLLMTSYCYKLYINMGGKIESFNP